MCCSIIMSKVCMYCRESKDNTEFATRRGYPLKTCKNCNREKSKEGYYRNKETRQEYNQNYGRDSAECVCGSCVMKRNLPQHYRSRKHIDFLNFSRIKPEIKERL